MNYIKFFKNIFLLLIIGVIALSFKVQVILPSDKDPQITMPVKLIYFKGLAADTSDFIQFADGTVEKLKVEKFSQSVGFGAKIKVNGKTYNLKKLKSYKILGSNTIVYKGKPLSILKMGNINMYGQDTYKFVEIKSYGKKNKILATLYDLYFQKGDGEIQELTIKNLSKATSENEETQELIRRYQGNTQKTRLIEQAVDKYNGLKYTDEDYYEFFK